MDLVIFFYVLRFGLIFSNKRAWFKDFTSAFRSALLFPNFFILFLQAFPLLVIADNGIVLLLLSTVL
ncbi:hypothetical protein Hanom_Chr09g00859871 [Helianthus anomalus]